MLAASRCPLAEARPRRAAPRQPARPTPPVPHAPLPAWQEPSTPPFQGPFGKCSLFCHMTIVFYLLFFSSLFIFAYSSQTYDFVL